MKNRISGIIKYLKTEPDCVKRAVGGDKSAMGVLYQRYYDYLLNYAKQRVKNENDAQDIVSEVFVSVFKNISKLRDYEKFVSWLFGITRNKIKSYYRKNHNTWEKLLSFQELFLIERAVEPMVEYNTERENNEYLKNCVKRLDTEEQELIRLHYYLDFNSYEIAKMKRRSERDIRRKLKQIIDRLRQKYFSSLK